MCALFPTLLLLPCVVNAGIVGRLGADTFLDGAPLDSGIRILHARISECKQEETLRMRGAYAPLNWGICTG